MSQSILGFAAVFSTAALGEDDCRCWTPGAADIAALEAKVESRPKPRGLDQYARYYAGMVGRSGTRFIRIHLVPSGRGHPAGSHVVAPAPQPTDSECSGWEASGALFLRCASVSSENWTPGADQIGAMEAQIAEQSLPLGGLDRYTRYYAGVGRRNSLDGYVESNAGVAIDHGRLPLFLRFESPGGSRVRRILGTLIPAGGDDLPGVHIEQRPARLMAEGCVAAFDADRTQLTSFKCGPGDSTPAVAQVTELEDLLRQHGGPKLEDYRRYYFLLVMHDGRKVIYGDLLPASSFEAGVYFGRSPVIVFDGKCTDFDTVWYDPSSKIAAWQCSRQHPSTDDWGIRTYDPASGRTMRGGGAARAAARLFGNPSDDDD
jgi:hypothetical protein